MRGSDVIIPMLMALLPVSAHSDNDWARGAGSQLAFEFPTLSETARPVSADEAPTIASPPHCPIAPLPQPPFSLSPFLSCEKGRAGSVTLSPVNTHSFSRQLDEGGKP